MNNNNNRIFIYNYILIIFLNELFSNLTHLLIESNFLFKSDCLLIELNLVVY